MWKMKFSCWELAPFHGDSPQNTLYHRLYPTYFFSFLPLQNPAYIFFDLNCILHSSCFTFLDDSLMPGWKLFIFVQINVWRYAFSWYFCHFASRAHCLVWNINSKHTSSPLIFENFCLWKWSSFCTVHSSDLMFCWSFQVPFSWVPFFSLRKKLKRGTRTWTPLLNKALLR